MLAVEAAWVYVKVLKLQTINSYTFTILNAYDCHYNILHA